MKFKVKEVNYYFVDALNGDDAIRKVQNNKGIYQYSNYRCLK